MMRHWLSFFAVGFLVFRFAGGYLDGHVAPVLVDFQITSHYPEKPSTTHISATAEKLRNCRWIRTEWFVGLRGGTSIAVPVLHHEVPQTRGVGQIGWSDIEIILPWSMIELNSHADVIHDCYGGWLWETRTPLYDAPEVTPHE